MPEEVQESVKTDRATCVAVSVTDASTTVAAANPTRVSVLIQNLDTDPIYLEPGGAATVAGSMQLKQDATFEEREYTGAINAIVASGTADVRVWETG